ncbi:MAG: hypothetical protein P8N47_01075 [Bacteroidia bacterium]|jgi:hypothetical protein|nr:hypothetical protein [Bacteroidia bacterium]
MKKRSNSIFAIFSIAIFFFGGCKEKVVDVNNDSVELQVDRRYRPLLHHFGSTGCGGCGRWGIPLVNRLGDRMGDSIIPLITHFKYNDPFITASSQRLEETILNARYSPQVWINNKDITLPMLYTGLEASIVTTQNMLRDSMKKEAKAFVGFQAIQLPSTRYDAEVMVENNTDDSATFFVEIYSMQDGLIASQAGADPYASTHYRVNRGGHYGGMGKEIRLAAGETSSDQIEIIPCWVCDANALYFYAIIWEEIGNDRFSYVNGKVIEF